jgi:hypothetical protein
MTMKKYTNLGRYSDVWEFFTNLYHLDGSLENTYNEHVIYDFDNRKDIPVTIDISMGNVKVSGGGFSEKEVTDARTIRSDLKVIKITKKK